MADVILKRDYEHQYHQLLIKRNRFWNTMEPFHIPPPPPPSTSSLPSTPSPNNNNCNIASDINNNIITNNGQNSLNNNHKNNLEYFNNKINNSFSELITTNYYYINFNNQFTRTIFWKYLIVVIFILLTLSSNGCEAARQEVSSGCTFPERWEGTWFLSGHTSVVINASHINFRGKCVAKDGGDKFLMVDESGCHRCVVIYEKHKNVLQYKESECEDMYMEPNSMAAMPMPQMRNILKSDHRGGAHPNTNGHSRLSSSDQFIMRSNDDIHNCPPDYCKGRDTLHNLCEQIPGDALLYSMFKEDAEPVKCPLKGPFTFSYNRGNGECRSPVSHIESCTEESRLLLSFQACPDITGIESTVEELTCLAAWKDGNARYLVGLVNALNTHHLSVSNEDRYRCFVYEKISSDGGGGSSKDAEYKLAQSGDATCNGLDSAEVGSRIMTLRKPPAAERCHFPTWFKGPKHWHALMGNIGYTFHQNDGSMHIIKQSGYLETRALCEQINKQTATEMQAVVHYTTRCQSGFMCMMFYRRDTHVTEIQMGKTASRLEDACALDHFDVTKISYVTLLTSNPESEVCPKDGVYALRGPIGPPYITTRHKRNHSNKNHTHGHHHEIGYRRQSSLSFRNSEEIDKNSWQGTIRGISTRNRRNLGRLNSNNDDGEYDDGNNIVEDDDVAANDNSVSGELDRRLIAAKKKVLHKNFKERKKRDVPTCTVNVNSNRQLLVGCTEQNIIEVRPHCSEDRDEVYTCHGSWTENQTVYVIAKHAGTQHGVCLTYRTMGENNLQLYIGDSCFRGGDIQSPDHYLIVNLTNSGKCSDTNSSIRSTLVNGIVLLLLPFLIVIR